MTAFAGQTATVAADGSFYIVVTLGSNQYGTASAQTSDPSGQSNIALTPIG